MYLVRVSDVGKVIVTFLVRVTECVWSTYVTAVRSLGPCPPPPPRLFDGECVCAGRVIIAESGALPARH